MVQTKNWYTAYANAFSMFFTEMSNFTSQRKTSFLQVLANKKLVLGRKQKLPLKPRGGWVTALIAHIVSTLIGSGVSGKYTYFGGAKSLFLIFPSAKATKTTTITLPLDREMKNILDQSDVTEDK